MVVSKTTKGKKKWISIVGPATLKNNFLGESYVYDPQILIGRKLKLNLSQVLGDMRKQNVNLGFKIKELKGNEAYAEIIYYEIVPAYVKRMVRTGKEKIDDSFVIETKNKIKLKIKPVIITKNKASRLILTKLRMITREKINQFSNKEDIDVIFDKVISGQLQKELDKNLRKIYPLNNFEIRRLEILNK